MFLLVMYNIYAIACVFFLFKSKFDIFRRQISEGFLIFISSAISLQMIVLLEYRIALMSKCMTHTVCRAAITLKPLRVKQSNDIVHRYGALAEADDQKRRQPKTSCDERIALRGSLALYIREITHASWPDRIFPLCFLPLTVPRDTLSFLLMHMSRSFLLVWTSRRPSLASDEVLSRRWKYLPPARRFYPVSSP